MNSMMYLPYILYALGKNDFPELITGCFTCFFTHFKDNYYYMARLKKCESMSLILCLRPRDHLCTFIVSAIFLLFEKELHYIAQAFNLLCNPGCPEHIISPSS